MVFFDDKYNNGGLLYLGQYHRYWTDRPAKIKNPNFDRFSGLILDFKENKPAAIKYFHDRIDPYIQANVVITCVPSSDASKLLTGNRSLATALAASSRIDGGSCLIRTESVPKAATGGPRSVELHLRTIKVVNEEIIAGASVLLLDDVTTSGSSIRACKSLLERAGAGVVKMFVLGQTSA